MNLSTGRLGRLGAASAVGALVTTGLLVAAPAAEAVTIHFVRADQVDLAETRSTGHNDFSANGVRVWTEGATSTDKAAGYFDVNLDLADIGEPSLAWTPASPPVGNLKPSVQLKTDFDADGNIDGILVGEPTYQDGTPLYGNDWWLSNGSEQWVKDAAPSHTGGSGSANHGTLAQWRSVFENAIVVQSGWSLGSGVHGDGTITRISLGDDRYYFQPAGTPNVKTVYRSEVDTQYTRATGHNEFLPGGGVRVWTEGSTSTDKAAGYFNTNIPLAASGASFLTFDNTTAGTGGFEPGLQLVTDFNNDGTADGTLVGEPLYPGIYWLSAKKLNDTPVPVWLKDLAPRKNTEPGIPGYSAGGGTPAEWRSVFRDARILQVGWSLGSGAKGDGILNKITVGLHEFVFAANRAPVAQNVAASTPAGTSVTVTLAATDADGDALTYTSADGTVVGNKLTYTAPKDFAGTKVLTYQAKDPSNASGSGTVTVTVTKATSKTELTIAPGKITTKSKHVRGNVTVTSTGAVAGGTVDLFDGDTKVGTGVLAADGTATIAVNGKLTKGKHTFTAVYAGTNATATSEASVVVKVKKAKKK